LQSTTFGTPETSKLILFHSFPGGSPEFDTPEEMNVCYLDSPDPSV
jgi:hypothetical protein